MQDPYDPALGALLSLPPPRLSPGALDEPLAAHWGLRGHLTPLSSERDLNFRLQADLGGQGGNWLVKLSHPLESAGMSDFQSRVLLHLAARDPELPVPRLILTQTGQLWAEPPEGRLRVYSWLPGQSMHLTPVSVPQAVATGRALARLTKALQDFTHDAADHILLWDIKHLPRLQPLLSAIGNPEVRAEAEAVLTHFTAEIAPQLEGLPQQVCHADFNRHNLLVNPEDPTQITGVLDFGDMVRTPRICDLAVAASYQIDPAAPLTGICAILRGYTEILPLQPQEIALLFDLIMARMVTSLAIGGWRAARHPENAAYILRNTPAAQAGMIAFRRLDRAEASRAFACAAAEGAGHAR